jgi:thiamine biosynthesis protein ThiC
MPMQIWNDIRPRAQSPANDAIQVKAIEANGELIREVLAQRVQCPECLGKGERHVVLEGAISEMHSTERCDRCGCEGTVPATVPGAKLLPRAEHVRVI